MFTTITGNQLEFLMPNANEHRLDALLKPASSFRPTNHEFETVEVCQEEDRNRAAALQALKPKHRNVFPGSDALRIAAFLEANADPRSTKPFLPCVASATYMRGRRNGILATVLELLDENLDLQTAWITGSHFSLRFDQICDPLQAVKRARDRLQHELQIRGAATASGFLIAYLSGYFDPRINQFQLEFRGIAGGEKLLRIREKRKTADDAKAPNRGLQLAAHAMGKIPQQILGLMPNSLRELTVTQGGQVVGDRRMGEPYHSIYLMWLAQHALADFMVMSGVFYWDGRLKLSTRSNKNSNGAYILKKWLNSTRRVNPNRNV